MNTRMRSLHQFEPKIKVKQQAFCGLFEERLYDKKNFSEGRYDIRKAIERWLIRRYTVVVVVLLLCFLY